MKILTIVLLATLSSKVLVGQDLRGYHRHIGMVDSTSYVAIMTNKYRKATSGSGDHVTLIDTRTGTTRALELPDPISIHGVWLNNAGRHRGERFIVITASTGVNNRGKVTWSAPTALFICPLEGGPAVQISPEGTSVMDWEIQRTTNKMVMTATKDTNRNGKLDNDDDIFVLLYDLESGAVKDIPLGAPPQ